MQGWTKARIGVALTALAFLAAPALAQTGALRGAIAPQPAPAPALGQPGSSVALKPEQRALVEKVNRYLSSVQTLQGKFVQVAGDGRRTTGDFYLAKPGRVRFEYDD